MESTFEFLNKTNSIANKFKYVIYDWMAVSMSRIVFLGAPGAGKGTQAQKLADELHIPRLATGDMLRQAIEEGSEVGLNAKAAMDRGDLVPDEVVVGIVEERIKKSDCETGFILDGFPRTVEQAKSLDKMLKKNDIALSDVVCLEVDHEEVIKRQSGRRWAPKSGRVYHITNNPPKTAGKCDETGEDLIQRDDDTEEVLRRRLEVYEELTAPVRGFYEESQGVSAVNGIGAVDAVYADIKSVLK